MPPVYSGFKPLIGGGAQHPTPAYRPAATSKTGLNATANLSADAVDDPRVNRDASLRSPYVDAEEAAMLRAMARLNGDDLKTRARGNSYSQANRRVAANRQKEAAAMGLAPLDPHEQHELQRKLSATQKAPVKTSDRAVNVPRVGGRGPRPQYAPIDFVRCQTLIERTRIRRSPS